MTGEAEVRMDVVLWSRLSLFDNSSRGIVRQHVCSQLLEKEVAHRCRYLSTTRRYQQLDSPSHSQTCLSHFHAGLGEAICFSSSLATNLCQSSSPAEDLLARREQRVVNPKDQDPGFPRNIQVHNTCKVSSPALGGGAATDRILV